MNRTICYLAAVPIIIGAMPAMAGGEPIVATAPRGQVYSMSVSYADLNLAEQGGVDRLMKRVTYAAEVVCDVSPDLRPLTQKQESSRCYRGAMARAENDINIAVANVRDGTVVASRGSSSAIRIARR